MISKFRPDSVAAVQQLGDVLGVLLKTAFEKVGHDAIFQNCSTCRHWQEGGQNHLGEPTGCKKHRALPPVKVIVCGCADYDDSDEIPF